ncbi:hypothetical protein PVAG01_06333 [Phlyctema vagabunda]|uniref:Uncharacterized protein n=1 Tax=Phlyctema vagabunda TaxID=108571 RepID=A0ABR4PFR6_9HELO
MSGYKIDGISRVCLLFFPHSNHFTLPLVSQAVSLSLPFSGVSHFIPSLSFLLVIKCRFTVTSFSSQFVLFPILWRGNCYFDANHLSNYPLPCTSLGHLFYSHFLDGNFIYCSVDPCKNHFGLLRSSSPLHISISSNHLSFIYTFIIMQGPAYGALGATFTVVRAMQACSLIAIIGMTANFIGEMVSAEQSPPKVLIGTLSVTCISVLYCAITYILYFDSLLPFLVNTILDSLLLIAVIVVAVTVGKPLSYLDCAALPSKGTTSSFIASVGANMSKINYWVWAGASKTTCYEMKAVWGLSIALCILFSFSAVTSACLWRRQQVFVAKKMEGF